MAVKDDVGVQARARLGTVLKGKWTLDSVLGVGGMACVYAATHRNQSRVAIKMLHPDIALYAEVTSRFLREGYVANAVEHPGTVKVLDDDVTDDGVPFLVMERLNGETLDARLERLGPLPPEDVVLIADQLLDVLAAAHSRSIVHRDLKPENLFLTDDGRLKVLDFGIARLRELSAGTSTATRMGSLLGTPTFMASEQALGRWSEVDGRTDLWAVGATLYTLLTGHFVHEGVTLQEQLVLAATRPAASLRQVAPEVSAEFAAVVDRALCFGKAERWPDARSMQAAVRAAAPPGVVFPTLAGPGSPTPVRLRGGSAPTEIAAAVTGHSDTPAQALTRTATTTSSRRGATPYLVPAMLLAMFVGGFVLMRRSDVASLPPAAGLAESPPRVVQPKSVPSVEPRAEPDPSVAPEPSVLASAPVRNAAPPRPSARPPLPPKAQPAAAPRVDPPTPGKNPFDRRH
jgi:serine/threonine protein kinase